MTIEEELREFDLSEEARKQDEIKEWECMTE
jgi:hypothetical protein